MPVFDASLLIGLQRENPKAAALAKRSTGSVAIPAVAWMEVLTGFPVARQQKVDTALGQMGTFIPFTREIAAKAAVLQCRLLDEGKRVGWNDLQVAATAMHLGEPLVTLDRGFDGIPGLDVLRPVPETQA